jgi:hypothetical protein
MLDDPNDGMGPSQRSEPSHRTPRWVKVLGIVVIILAVLFVIGLVTGGGSHGPSRHTSSGSGGASTGAVQHP